MDLELLILGLLLFSALILFLLLFIYLPLRWVRKIAKRNGRSVSGFCWLFLLAPYIAWPILLTIDKREIRLEPESLNDE